MKAPCGGRLAHKLVCCAFFGIGLIAPRIQIADRKRRCPEIRHRKDFCAERSGSSSCPFLMDLEGANGLLGQVQGNGPLISENDTLRRGKTHFFSHGAGWRCSQVLTALLLGRKATASLGSAIAKEQRNAARGANAVITTRTSDISLFRNPFCWNLWKSRVT